MGAHGSAGNIRRLGDLVRISPTLAFPTLADINDLRAILIAWPL